MVGQRFVSIFGRRRAGGKDVCSPCQFPNGLLGGQSAVTDLEAFVGARGRDELVKQVRTKIDELTGRIMGKGAPTDHWEAFAERGFQLVYGSTANLFIDRSGHYIGYGPEAWELVGIPEPETFVQLPWDKRVGRVFCTLFRGRGGDYAEGDSDAGRLQYPH